MYKLILHKHAQCGFDGYSSENHVRTFYSYDTPIYSIYKERCDDLTSFRIQCINAPRHSATTAKQTTWSLHEELLQYDCARYVRQLLQKCCSGEKIFILSDMENGIWCVFTGGELLRTFTA